MSHLKSVYFLFTCCIAFLFISCGPDEEISNLDPHFSLDVQLEYLYGDSRALIIPDSEDLSSIPFDPKNQLTEEKVLLGKFLFHETGLAVVPKTEAGRGTYSCATCHHTAAGFQSGILQGLGEGGSGFGMMGEGRLLGEGYDKTNTDMQPIKSPTIVNTAYQEVMLWNGQFGALGINKGTENQWSAGTPKETNHLGFSGLEIQAIAGLGVHRMDCQPEMITQSNYKTYFDQAFPNVPQHERYTKINAGLAIAAYERTVLSNEAPFQFWLKGDRGAMTDEQTEGALLFFGKARCYECHDGPGLNGMGFHALGMKDLDHTSILGEVDENTRKGRGGFTARQEDDYKFKTPTLYNLKSASHLGHGGSFSTIREVIEYKNNGVPENHEVPVSKISSKFRPLGLSTIEIDQLEAFVKEALFDPNLQRYTPESTPMNSCFPNADPQSRIDLGCD
ncbi:cytochrome c peroxidase [Zeaxanthinibacter sp. PT1]|uniref:cytochrome-c peroxidase n=1 Tax=Zeaxanthinibacter TaxID=561554 RepID=UPI00234995DF|nr:cytochrome c peroxidase [Zeaxanthinibacter sp. PT1]MDC6350224.1 cytochrome c peroxidase [Zeaxanthinibacter sp. PT1]